MITFSYLNKAEKDRWLPRLFDLLYANMRAIAPTSMSYEKEKRQFLASVSPALDKAPRQIILCFAGDSLAGYVQYYVRDRLLMVEEMQIVPQYQRTFLFCRLCRHLIQELPADIAYIEAYADKRNTNSQIIMKKLGMEPLLEDAQSPFLHLRGTADRAKQLFR